MPNLRSVFSNSGVNEPHEGLRKTESQWPVHQINWQKSRYVYDMFYIYHRISREVYEYCIKNKLVDAALIAKWKKPGYERLCSTYVINPRNYKFGTVGICRVPKHCLAPGTTIEDPVTGCHGCASGPGGNKNIFGTKYGQYLAAIQVAREERQRLREELAAQQDREAQQGEEDEGKGESSDSEDDDHGPRPVSSAGLDIDGSGSSSKAGIWAQRDEEEAVELPEGAIGVMSGDADREGRAAMKGLGAGANGGDGHHNKKQRTG
jgi:bud site selection protein 31